MSKVRWSVLNREVVDRMLQTVDDERRSNDAARWSLLLFDWYDIPVYECLLVFRFHASLIVHNYVINIYTIRSLYKLELNRVCFVQISIRSTIPLKAINQNTTNKIYIVTRRKGLSGVNSPHWYHNIYWTRFNITTTFLFHFSIYQHILNTHIHKKA